MTVSHGVEGQLISEARICIYSDIKALKEGMFVCFYLFCFQFVLSGLVRISKY